MVLPVADALTTPCLTSQMNPAAREKLKENYRIAKRYGIKAAWGVITGSGSLTVLLNFCFKKVFIIFHLKIIFNIPIEQPILNLYG